MWPVSFFNFFLWKKYFRWPDFPGLRSWSPDAAGEEISSIMSVNRNIHHLVFIYNLITFGVYFIIYLWIRVKFLLSSISVMNVLETNNLHCNLCVCEALRKLDNHLQVASLIPFLPNQRWQLSYWKVFCTVWQQWPHCWRSKIPRPDCVQHGGQGDEQAQDHFARYLHRLKFFNTEVTTKN